MLDTILYVALALLAFNALALVVVARLGRRLSASTDARGGAAEVSRSELAASQDAAVALEEADRSVATPLL